LPPETRLTAWAQAQGLAAGYSLILSEMGNIGKSGHLDAPFTP
jgi:hypothetical protein